MNRFLNLSIPALLTGAIALPALADSSITLDHTGDARTILVETIDTDAKIVSVGDDGSLMAELGQNDDLSIYHLGGNSDAAMRLEDTMATNIFVGHCPAGMSPAPVAVAGAYETLIIPRCQ
jgi:hypothetical protein